MVVEIFLFLACRWEKDEKYCTKSLLVPSSEYYPILMDVIDSSVFDFLMGNFFLVNKETSFFPVIV